VAEWLYVRQGETELAGIPGERRRGYRRLLVGDEERIHPPGKGSVKVKRASSISRENDFFRLKWRFGEFLVVFFENRGGNFCLRSPKHA